jgi:hypothetical protein
MTYQAEILFKNGAKILSDIIEVPIEEKGKAIIYPNPVTSEGDLNIISEGGGLKFRVLDVLGKIILEKEIELVEDAIDVVDLSPGLYLYELISADGIKDTGRFVKY